MNPNDRAILEFCRQDFRPLKSLRTHISSGTLYRRVGRLLGVGWLKKADDLYQTTEAGLRQLAEAASGRRWDSLEQVYPPLGLVPTPVHRAVGELILAGVAARQQESRPDRHPFFVAFGGTLRWKTSLGMFICLALGLDPAIHVVECGSESGKSLSFRRSGTGTLVFKRELLDAPFIVLDEFLSADPSVRPTLNIFLGGRLVVPFENERLAVRPVPLLTLNPRAKDTLEARIGLSAPQIRRAILADFDVVPMPDLAMTGERALTAARAQAPLILSAPAVDCQGHHRPIVELTRAILVPGAHDRVDVEVVVNLSTGMTAFIPEPAEAIAQVGHALGVLAETLGWTQAGWIEAVSRFALGPAARQARSRPEPSLPASPTGNAEPSGVAEGKPAGSTTLSLQVPRPVRRETGVPDLSLSPELRARLIWLAVETGRTLEEVLALLVGIYLERRKDADTLPILERILSLARELEAAQVDVETLEGYLKAQAALAKDNCTFEDVPEALRLIDLLGELPEPWDWPRARTAIQAVTAILEAGISTDQVTAFLTRHQRLGELGFDEETAVAIAEALTQAGVTGERRDAVLHEMVASAGIQADCVALENRREQLQQSVAALERAQIRLRRTTKALMTRIRNLQRDEQTAQQRKDPREAEVERLRQRLRTEG